ncbi:MAG: 1-acyl-sn-glycerol-3-phosphate acyltransferase [Akkermansiaceae bacterium]|nr:1-acyl-sn-glycerol-3-phosphate acyltransferase [Verrucomicrobiales bacterium]
MDSGPDPTATPVPQRRVTRDVVFIQFLLGLGLHLFISLPFLRRTHGMSRLRPDQRCLLVVNHISLLDTLLLSTLCWRSGCYPILVLGDKKVWHASWIRKFLSKRTAFLLERGKLNPNRISDLEEFGRAGREFQLIVFPEGTRGDGVNVATCQPGIYYIAQAARLPIVPVFIENMQLVSTKTGGFHPIRGWRKVEVHFGKAISPEKYLHLPREEFVEFVRQSIMGAKSGT